MRIFVWGIGSESECLHFPEEIELIGGIDSDPNKCKTLFHGRPIIAPSMLAEYSYDYILISSHKYELEIITQLKQLDVPLSKVLPAELAGPLIHSQFEDTQRMLATSIHFEIVKGWYQNQSQREILVKVHACWGKIMIMDIFPYGLFAETDEAKEVACRIMDLGTETILYEGKWKNTKRVKIPLDSNEAVFKVCIEGNLSCYLNPHFVDGNLLREIGKLSSVKIQQKMIHSLAYCFDQNYHERDYSFLEMYGETTNATILDIGANLGQSAFSFLRLTKMDVIAVEPQINMLEPLQLIQKNFGEGRMSIINKGAGDICGQLSFFIPAFEEECTEEASFLRERALERTRACDFSENELVQMKVPVETVDQIVKSIEKPIFFVKIDAEKFEDKVVGGMTETIKTYHPLILLEYNNAQQQQTILDMVNTIFEYSIGYWNYNNKTFEKKNLSGSLNYFLIPKDFSWDKMQEGDVKK